MGINIYAHLFYGIDIGETIKYDLSQWTEEEVDELEEDEYLEPSEYRLYYLRKIGKDNLPYEEQNKIVDDLNVHIIRSISYEVPEYSVAVNESIIEVDWSLQEVDITKILNSDYKRWNQQLREFFEKIGILGNFDSPRWYMGIMYSG